MIAEGESTPNDCRRLIKYGFVKQNFISMYAGKKRKEIDKVDDTSAKKHADEEKAWDNRFYESMTGYPKSLRRYRIILESYQQSIEESYFWILDHLRIDHSFQVEKIIDAFAAAENSAFFGVVQQRIGLQQEKVSQFLATIGKMTREMFQLVRELRILDERLSIYNASYGMGTESKKASEAAEITLKGYWIDLVEGGAKNPASVYGMSRELGFTTLPDLFFAMPPIDTEKVDEEVDKLDFNRKIKEVLKRKLKMYAEWKRHTYKELKTRRKFTLKYLRQHFDIIKMYMAWVRPYLYNLKRLMLDQEKTKTADLIVAFEGSVLEIEVMAKRKADGPYWAVILVSILYRTRPAMSYQQEGYQRGPIHVGKVDIKMRAYSWTQQQMENYRKMREDEDFEVLKAVDASVKAAMEALGDELEEYLKQAGEEDVEFEKEPEKQGMVQMAKSAADPFTSIVMGFGEIFGAFVGYTPGQKKPSKDMKKEKKMSKQDLYQLSLDRQVGEKLARTHMWRLYKIYKKAHRMLSW